MASTLRLARVSRPPASSTISGRLVRRRLCFGSRSSPWGRIRGGGGGEDQGATKGIRRGMNTDPHPPAYSGSYYGVPGISNQRSPQEEACGQESERQRTNRPIEKAKRAWNNRQGRTPNANKSSRFARVPLGRPCTSYREVREATRVPAPSVRPIGPKGGGASALSVAIRDLATEVTGGAGRSPQPHRIYQPRGFGINTERATGSAFTEIEGERGRRGDRGRASMLAPS